MTDTRSTTGQRRPVRGTERTPPGLFYRQVVAELRKVIWPTRQQLSTYFVVVLVFVLAVIAIVSVLDFVFGTAVINIFG